MWRLVAALVLTTAAAEESERYNALRCRHARCRYMGGNGTALNYNVDGKDIIIVSDDFRYITVECNGFNVLESPALPSAEPALQLLTMVTLVRCPLPAGDGSLADTLDTLNVTLLFSNLEGVPLGMLTLDELPPSPPLAATHFTGLERLVALQIYAEKGMHVTPERGFLDKLRDLTLLKTVNVMMHPDELDALPSLIQLVLHDVRMERLPEPPALKILSLAKWTELRPMPLTHCRKLRRMQLTEPSINALPNGWLANCSALAELVVLNARNLIALPPMLLRDSHYAITFLAFKQGVLKTLPAKLLKYAPKLRTLELDGNNLDGRALTALAHHSKLTVLDLGRNKRIGDVCEKNGYSPISNMTKLTSLFLNGTNLTRICRDWRQNMTHLKMLDLSGTRVSELSFEDLQFTRDVKATVLLLGAPVATVETMREDFHNSVLIPRSNTFVELNSALECDCRMYWTRRTLDRSPFVLDHVRELRCAAATSRDPPRLLSELPPEDMMCAGSEECMEAALPTACSCTVRPDDDPAQDRRLVRVRCENAALADVPLPWVPDTSPPRLYELLLAHNHISSLHADQLHNIKGLDLRNNSLQRVDEQTAMSLGHVGGVLRFANNPLDCSCHAAPLLRALRGRATTDTDMGNATCSDGSALSAAPTVDCPSPAPWVAGGLALLFALTVTVGVTCLASRERRFFIKAVLHRWGCLWYPAETEESDERPYDAFVTFSHKDEAVVLELLARLEPPYRLCVHHRDWIPGLRIPDQIVDSVRNSRRTVALVSRHFLNSMWARVEFREAHTAAMVDARPRLVVVLLEDPSALEMDDQLRQYVSTHTYLRWGDSWFWHKLAVALPRPRQPQAVQLDCAYFASPAPATLLALPASSTTASSPAAEPSESNLLASGEGEGA